MPLPSPELPYSTAALVPEVSADALAQHLQLHRQCVDAINAATAGTSLADAPLEELLAQCQGRLFELAATAWNHDIHWQSLRARGGGEPGGRLGSEIARQFGNTKRLRAEFARAAGRLDGPGWLWLVQRQDATLAVIATAACTTPATGSDQALLACDLWEHAYWLDHPDDRDACLEGFWRHVNWDFAASRMR